ncbi:MAG: hypothetical protein DBX57_07085 [Clostridia bacterium]|nr:MAG: hypothetical protein DBX57_07085 [Clostridia bacterium]
MRSGLRGCQKTIKYSSATEQRGKSERGKKPLSRSIKQFSELFKFRKLDGQRGEKVFFSPLPARNAMRSGLRGCQKTIKYSSATEQRGKSERGKKPLSRSIKQFSELFKFRKLDGQRGEKVFFSPLPARNAMRSGLLFAERPPLPRGGCRRRRLGEKSPPQCL